MKWIALVLLTACGRESTEVPVNAFKGSWSGVAYASTLSDLYEAKVTFEDERMTWRINKQPGSNDFLVAEGSYTHNESGFLILTLDRAYFDKAGETTALGKQGSCFEDADGVCVLGSQQSSQYLVSGSNVQFSVKVGEATVVTNVNREL